MITPKEEMLYTVIANLHKQTNVYELTFDLNEGIIDEEEFYKEIETNKQDDISLKDVDSDDQIKLINEIISELKTYLPTNLDLTEGDIAILFGLKLGIFNTD